jgi:nucleoside-diphosphate-sugar epimerase
MGATGAIGRAVAETLHARGVPFRVVGRSRGKLEKMFAGMPGAEICEADLSKPEDARRAARGVDTLLYAVGVLYDSKEFATLPGLMRTMVDAAVAENVERLLLVSNVYPYGIPKTPKVSEDHPRDPVSFKGQMRKEQEDVVFEAQKNGRLKTIVLRLPDFYGPLAELSVTRTIFEEAIAGKTANVLGPVEPLHEYVYVPDTGPVIADLLGRDDCYGGAYNLAGHGALAQRDYVTMIFEAAGHKPRWRSAGPFMIRMLGLFIPIMKELVEMYYLQKTPVLLDDTKLAAKLGPMKKTPYREGIQATVDWMKAHPKG